jgi:protein-S-isoprenylcysteine O-methyltransferase
VKIGIVALILVVLFPIGEVALVLLRRARSGIARHADEGSTGALWLVILCCLTAAIAGLWFPRSQLPGPRWLLLWLATALLAMGLTVRWLAIVSLGRFFTVDVAIHQQHVLVSKGIYRYVRHPSYSGLLLAFAGLGVFFGTWLALSALTVPLWLAFSARIRREEAALLQGLGASYSSYCARTKRLLPGIY